MIVVVIPSRGRPARAWEAVAAVRQHAALVSTSVVLAVDEDDPDLGGYETLDWPGLGPEVAIVRLSSEETGTLVRATNTVSMRIAREDPTSIIGNLGDDHLVRTPGWDRLVTEALATPGIAYGDDLLQGKHLPTAPFISAAIPLALGWYALPSCRHMYIDDVWRTLGEDLGRLRYLPDLVIEHMHPAAHKAATDAGYERANAEAAVVADRAAYNEWHQRYRRLDMKNVRRALR